MSDSPLPVQISLLTTKGKNVRVKLEVVLRMKPELSFPAGPIVTYAALYGAILESIQRDLENRDLLLFMDSLETHNIEEES
jgi:hypothetical protein